MNFIRAMVAAILATALPACGQAQSSTPLIPALEKLADRNNAEAIYHLGMAYHTGSGVAEDHAKALAAFRRAAALGDPLASYKLGCYYSGQGAGLVAGDEVAALKYKLVAAEAGYALAQQDVSAIYYQRGDMAATLVWLEKAAAQGWPDSLTTYAAFYNGVPGVTPDAAKAVAYFTLSLRGAAPTKVQSDWLAKAKTGMESKDLERAAALVSAYRPRPTALTLKGLSGQRAAQQLIDQSG